MFGFAVLATARSAIELMLGVVETESFPRYVSPPPLVVAVFVSEAGADCVTVPARLMAGYAALKPFSASLRVQVTSCPVWLHDHPVPLADVIDKPNGNTSFTLTKPDVL